MSQTQFVAGFEAIRPTASAAEAAVRRNALVLGLHCEVESHGVLRKQFVFRVTGHPARVGEFVQWWDFMMGRMGLR